MAWGYSSGAPKDACADLAPHHIDSSQHEILAQTTPFPYAIDVEKSTIKSGDKVRVVISGTERSKTFEGFFVQARVGNIAVGKFDAAPNVKLVDCGNSQAVSFIILYALWFKF